MKEDNFDVLQELKLSRREAVLHTPMIAGLLDPFGLHPLGNLFLGRFLKTLSSPRIPLERTDASNSEWIIRREQRIPGGCLDIVLLCPRKRIAIAIENKIDALVDPRQLHHYMKWLGSLGPDFTNTRLFLLTLDEGDAAKVPGGGWGAIGYAKVLDCLLQCLDEKPLIAADSFIRSYARTVANLLQIEQPRWVKIGEPAEETCSIFYFLGITRREDVLHTRMLAFLLNPKGRHDQKSTFLSSFLSLLASLEGLQSIEQQRISESINSDWIIESEVKLEGRRIDILLRCLSRQLLIGIENKIDAPENENQLLDSAQELRRQYSELDSQVLVFLTITGNPPLSAGNAQVHLLSYKRILELVSNFHQQLGSGPIKGMVGGYCDVLGEIIPQPGTSTRAADCRLIPSPKHGAAAFDFLNEFVAK